MQINGQANVWNIERKVSNQGSEYTSFSVSLSKKNQDGTYENGNLRATAHKFNHDKMKSLNDGDSVYFAGEIQPNNYQDKQGNKVYGFQLFTREIHKIEKTNNNQGFNEQSFGAQNFSTQNFNANNSPSNFMTNTQNLNNELPF